MQAQYPHQSTAAAFYCFVEDIILEEWTFPSIGLDSIPGQIFDRPDESILSN